MGQGIVLRLRVLLLFGNVGSIEDLYHLLHLSRFEV